MALVAVVGSLFGSPGAAARPAPQTAADQSAAAVAGAKIFRSDRSATHIAVHWRGQRSARVLVRFSRDGTHFAHAQRVPLDELSEQHPTSETYGAIMVAPRVRAVKVITHRRLGRVSVLFLTDRGRPVPPAVALATAAQPAAVALATAAQPAVTPRVDWGADESLRYDATGKEIWPSAFYPVQKLIVHHTATQNNDPDPAATVRSIYYYHAVTQGWGDIGYNFLIDESGRIYEGRHTFDYATGSSPNEEDAAGNGVTAAHAQGYNSGTVGIALLGTLTSQDATPAARNALEHLLAWEADHHGIDAQGSALYTNPVSGTQATFPNIAGHRDVAATECPGGTFYATLPQIRADVAAMLAGTAPAPDFSLSASPTSRTVVRGSSTSYAVSVLPASGFADPVALSISGVPAGASASFSPNPATGSSTLAVATARTTPTGSYTLTVTGSDGALVHRATVTLQIKRK